jgi:hypothetical protein
VQEWLAQSRGNIWGQLGFVLMPNLWPELWMNGIGKIIWSGVHRVIKIRFFWLVGERRADIAILNQLQTHWASPILIKLVLIKINFSDSFMIAIDRRDRYIDKF